MASSLIRFSNCVRCIYRIGCNDRWVEFRLMIMVLASKQCVTYIWNSLLKSIFIVHFKWISNLIWDTGLKPHLDPRKKKKKSFSSLLCLLKPLQFTPKPQYCTYIYIHSRKMQNLLRIKCVAWSRGWWSIHNTHIYWPLEVLFCLRIVLNLNLNANWLCNFTKWSSVSMQWIMRMWFTYCNIM